MPNQYMLLYYPTQYWLVVLGRRRWAETDGVVYESSASSEQWWAGRDQSQEDG